MKNSLSQVDNKSYIKTKLKKSNEEKDNKNIEFIETQILSQNNNYINNNDNKLEETQKIPSQESIFLPSQNGQLDFVESQKSQELIFLSPTNNQPYIPTQRDSPKGELSTVKNNFHNEISYVPYSINIQNKIKNKKSSNELSNENINQLDENHLLNENLKHINETQKFSSQGEELLSPEFNIEFELNNATNSHSLNYKNSSKSPNLMSIDPKALDNKSPKLITDNFNFNEESVNVLENNEIKKPQINCTPESPGFFSPTLNIDLIPPSSNNLQETLKSDSQESKILPFNQSFSQEENNKITNKDNDIIILDQDNDKASNFSLISKLIDNKELSVDNKSLNQNISEISKHLSIIKYLLNYYTITIINDNI